MTQHNVDAWGKKWKLTASADAQTPAAVTDAPDSGEKIAITDVIVTVAAAMELTLEEETSGTEVLTFHMAQDATEVVNLNYPIVLPTANKKLMVDTDTAGEIAVTVVYYSTKNGLP